MPSYSSQRIMFDGSRTSGEATISGEASLTQSYDVNSQRNVPLSHVEEGLGLVEQYRNASIAFLLLSVINLISFVDRFCLIGLLEDIKVYYTISESTVSLLQTVLHFSFVLASLVCGYIGDRCSRRHLLIAGLVFSSVATFAASFLPPYHFGAFLFLRILSGIGQASCMVLPPTIIADLSARNYRTKVLTMFYAMVPVGSGLGYVLSSELSNLFGLWQWSLRLTPPLGFLCAIIAFIYLKDPIRGHSEGTVEIRTTSMSSDLYDLYKTPTCVWMILASTMSAFSFSAFARWFPDYLQMALALRSTEAHINTTTLFGAIVIFAGTLGVAIGSFTSQFLRHRVRKIDPLICAVSCFVSLPFISVVFVIIVNSFTSAIVSLFFGVTCIFVNLPLVYDILLYVIVPTRRALAIAVQIFISGLLGDISSPYICGLVSDAILKHGHKDPSTLDHLLSLQYALYIPLALLLVGGLCSLIAAMHVEKDRTRCDLVIRGVMQPRHISPNDLILPQPVRIAADDVLPNERAYLV